LEEQSNQIDILQTIQDKDKLNQILNFLDKLGPEKKEIFLLRIWNEMSYEEIAHIIEKNPNTCKVTFHRTLQTVIQKFGYM
jgi:RNA polymerase sigma factor (sigma-70 family)